MSTWANNSAELFSARSRFNSRAVSSREQHSNWRRLVHPLPFPCSRSRECSSAMHLQGQPHPSLRSHDDLLAGPGIAADPPLRHHHVEDSEAA